MVTTDDLPLLGEYSFNSSPESYSDNAFSPDYMDVASDEDFLTQLSADLDIPLLLNPGEDELSMLNSFYDKSPEEILSDVTSPPTEIDEIKELQQMDFTQWGPESFPNLCSEVKSEPSSGSESHSPVQFEPSKFEDSIKLNTPPTSPGNDVVYTFVQQPNTVNKIIPKRVPIQPKNPYSITKKNPVVVIKNNVTPTPKVVPKVVVLENVTAVPVNNINSLLPTVPNTSLNLGSIPVPSIYYGNSLESNIDPKVLKRQQRKIKNRESACLSRKKKKDYLTSLEEKVKELTGENQRLLEENAELKQKLSKYEGSSTPNLNKKQGIALCIFLLVVGVNFDFLRSPFNTNQVDLVKTDKAEHIGRSLLWAPEDSSETTNSSNYFPLTMCPATINQTESARLVLELERWIGKPFQPFNNNTSNLTKTKKKIKRARKKYRLDLPLYEKLKPLPRENKNELEVFSPTAEQIYSEFFEAINRQDDTYYVVSFSDHHMLLPALHHNKTRRPKMSLIMPSILPNGTAQTNFMPLMQIDCEVLDTRLIQVKYGTIPQHLRSGNHSAESKQPESSARNQANAKKAYKPYFINKRSLYNIN